MWKILTEKKSITHSYAAEFYGKNKKDATEEPEDKLPIVYNPAQPQRNENEVENYSYGMGWLQESQWYYPETFIECLNMNKIPDKIINFIGVLWKTGGFDWPLVYKSEPKASTRDIRFHQYN